MTGENSRVHCPHNQRGLQGDFDNSLSCVLTGRPDADSRGWGYDNCDFAGDNYRDCSRCKSAEAAEEKKKNLTDKV